ncbi:MAG: aldo/keto reductase [Spirochaetaceae bacterium]
MKKIVLGKSDLNVSQLGLGCISFGSRVSKKKSFELMDCYVENGGNFFDTANCYSIWVENCNGSESETVIGEWLNERNNRKDIIIATKVGALPKPGDPSDFSILQGNSPDVILKEVDKCLKRLQTDYIDLLYLHIDDRDTDLKETLLALNSLRLSGKIKAYGASNFKTWRLEQARNICLELDIPFFSAIQQRFSYLAPVSNYDAGVQQFVNDELIDYISYYNDITLVGYSIALHGQYNNEQILNNAYDTKDNRDKLIELKNKTEKPTSWVLNWVCNQFNGSVALVTTSSIKHLKENIEYIKLNIT